MTLFIEEAQLDNIQSSLRSSLQNNMYIYTNKQTNSKTLYTKHITIIQIKRKKNFFQEVGGDFFFRKWGRGRGGQRGDRYRQRIQI